MTRVALAAVVLAALLAFGCKERDTPAAGENAAPAATEAEGPPAVAARGGEPSLVLYALPERREARLVDASWTQRHRWRTEGAPWDDVALDDRGRLIAVGHYGPVMALSPDSEVLWTAPVVAHSDVALLADGGAWTLTSSVREIESEGEWVRILDDALTLLTPAGEVAAQVSLYDVLVDAPASAAAVRGRVAAARDYWQRLGESRRARIGSERPAESRDERLVDVFVHESESLGAGEMAALLAGSPAEVIGARGATPVPPLEGAWSAEAVLVTSPGLGLVAAVAPARETVAWARREKAVRQAVLLPGGLLLAIGDEAARAVDVASGELAWERSLAGEADPAAGDPVVVAWVPAQERVVALSASGALAWTRAGGVVAAPSIVAPAVLAELE